MVEPAPGPLLMLDWEIIDRFLERLKPSSVEESIRTNAFLLGWRDKHHKRSWHERYDRWFYVDQVHYEMGRHFAAIFPKVDAINDPRLTAYLFAQAARLIHPQQ